ncbi:hypothetical protein P5V15_002710 [Pogonomyrmex californicus]
MGTVRSQIYGRASKRGQTERDRSRLWGVNDLDGSMLGDRRFDVAADDSVIVGDTRYPDTSDLYKLIFKRLSDDVVYTKNDKQTYKSILLTMNAHRRGHNALMPILGNKGFKYKHIIVPLLLDRDKSGAGTGKARKKRSTLFHSLCG